MNLDLRKLFRDALRSLGLRSRAEGRGEPVTIDLSQERQTLDEQLKRYLDAEIDSVRILATRDGETCPACSALDGTVMSVEEAIRTMALPHPGCTSEECRCTFQPLY